jgi:cell division protein FtsQ
MTSVTPVSETELITRRKELKQKRRVRSLQTIWRSLALCGLTSGVLWVCNLPDWTVRKPEQISISGNKLLTTEQIRKLLPITYPQLLLKIEPNQVAKKLTSVPPIAEVTVNRQLIPPGLTIQVVERKPVARAINTQTKTPTMGYIDAYGVWIPEKTYSHLSSSQLPALKVIGNPKQYRNFWAEMYKQLSRSPVEVTEIDWQNPANLILKTPLGIVHLGPYSNKFSAQLVSIDKMRELPKQINLSDIVYIDIKNPDTPSVQMNQNHENKDPVTENHQRTAHQ